MKSILNYIYTGQISVDESNVRDIIVAAYSLGMETLLPHSRTLAVRSLNTTNCVPLFLAACKIKQLGISKASYRFIVVNFQEIARNENSGFEDLPVEHFEKFLSLDNLNVSSENQVWDAIVLWVRKSTRAKNVYLENLIRHIRFDGRDYDFVSGVISHPLVQKRECCVQLLKNITNDSSRFKLRCPKMFYFITKLFLSRSDYDEGIKIFITFDDRIDIWRNVSSRIFTPNVVLLGFGSFVVMFETKRNIIYTYDIVSKTWSTLASPVIPRIGYNVVKIGRFIYVLGGVLLGNDSDQVVTTAERYNFESQSWEVLNPHYDLYETEAAAVNNNIYIIGTATGYFSDFLAAQVYYPETDMWESIRPPDIFRRQFGLVVYKSQLFILGGHDIEGCVPCVEKYDENKKFWRRFTDLPFPYYFPKGVIINDVLYVYDSHSDENYRCPPVFLDEASEMWEVVEASSPFCDLHVYQFCAVEDSDVIVQMQRENRNAFTKWDKSPFFSYINTRDNIE